MAGSRPSRADLSRLAAAAGVQSSYRDVDHRQHRASPEALEAVLEALGAGTDAPAREQPLAGRPEPEFPGAVMPQVAQPSWGVFLPLHALRTKDDWGVGSFTDLAELYRWVTGLGGSTVGTLPLLAQFLDEPYEYSPYSPASRLLWNELYVDPAATPEFERSRDARRLAGGAARPRGRRVDYRRTYAAKRPVIEALAGEFFGDRTGTERRRAFERYRGEQPHLDDYARFRAFGERTRKAWLEWPARQRAGRIDAGDVDRDAVRFHQYAQFVADEQLASIGKTAPGQGLYLDMPLGVNGASYDTWRFRDAFAMGVSGGAPPDTFFTGGQTWGFPPLNPLRMFADDFAYLRACIRHLARHAGVLRIDHMMGFHRLFWVPDGMAATEGVYVRSPAESLYAVLADEAHRAGTAVTGEDLGTVPRPVRTAMTRHGVLRSHVVELESLATEGDPLPPPPRASLASLNTHDLFPFAGFWAGADVDDRHRLGLVDAAEAKKERAERVRLTRRMTRQLVDDGWLRRTRRAVAEPQDRKSVV